MSLRVRIDFRELVRLRDQFKKVIDEKVVESWIEECLRDLAKKHIRKLKRRTPYNTGLLRNSWTIGTITKQGDLYEIEVYTDIEYASFVEKGFRAHFVPGYWESNQFIYDPNAKTGMYVGKPGGFVQGKFMMKFSEEDLKRELPTYLARKQQELLQRIIRRR